jgi:hypothetical protein
MKVTGLILAFVGLLGGVFCVAQLIMPVGPERDVPPIVGDSVPRLNLMIPLAVCGLAFVIGAMMLIFGGRSYFVSNNPRVRN